MGMRDETLAKAILLTAKAVTRVINTGYKGRKGIYELLKSL